MELPESGIALEDEQFDGADWAVDRHRPALIDPFEGRAVRNSFHSCSLLGTSFVGADVRGMRLSDTDLSYAVLRGAGSGDAVRRGDRLSVR